MLLNDQIKKNEMDNTYSKRGKDGKYMLKTGNLKGRESARETWA
jgi:hypothetical protein